METYGMKMARSGSRSKDARETMWTRDQIASLVKAQFVVGAKDVPIEAIDIGDAVRVPGESEGAYRRGVRSAVLQICQENNLEAVPSAGELIWYFRRPRHPARTTDTASYKRDRI